MTKEDKIKNAERIRHLLLYKLWQGKDLEVWQDIDLLCRLAQEDSPDYEYMCQESLINYIYNHLLKQSEFER